MVQRQVQFLFQGEDGRQRVLRRQSARFAKNCVSQVDRLDGVMMWEAISCTNRNELVLWQGNLRAIHCRNEILWTSHAS